MDRLAGMFAREQHLVEVLLFKLVETRHLLAAGDGRFLAWSATGVERAVDRVRWAELRRAVLLLDVADGLRIDSDDLTLSTLAQHAQEPWRSVFLDHRTALRELLNEIEEVAEENRRMAKGTRVHLGGAKDGLEMEVAEYGYRSVLDTVACLSLPSLAQFLA